MARITVTALRTFVALLALGPVTAGTIAFAAPAPPGARAAVAPKLTHAQMVRLMYGTSNKRGMEKVSNHALLALGYNMDEASRTTAAVQRIALASGSFEMFSAVARGTTPTTVKVDARDRALLTAAMAKGDSKLQAAAGGGGYTWEGSER